jgi:LDH2 family malate/lactate/ureidoglycolate dehydrogenase
MAGLLLPLGGERGLALGLLVELLSILGGGRLSSQVTLADDRWGGLELGQTFIAIDPTAWCAPGELAAQVAQLQAETRRLAGRAPGDRRRAARMRALEDGVPLSGSVAEQLETLGREMAIPAPL